MQILPSVLEDIILDYKSQLDFKYIYIVEHINAIMDKDCIYTTEDIRRIILTLFNRNYHISHIVKSLNYLVKYGIVKKFLGYDDKYYSLIKK